MRVHNSSVDAALTWLMDHEKDADIDDPAVEARVRTQLYLRNDIVFPAATWKSQKFS